LEKQTSIDMDRNTPDQPHKSSGEESKQQHKNPFEPADNNSSAQELTEEDAALEQQKKEAMTERD
jgi:hypothetical protein